MTTDDDAPRNNGENTARAMPVGKRFEPGNPGRPKGSRNKLGEAFLSDMLADWEEHGATVIQAVRGEKPDVYLKVVASILPQQLNVKVSEIDELTDEQLARQLAHVVASLAAAGIDFGAGVGAAAGPEQAGKVSALH